MALREGALTNLGVKPGKRFGKARDKNLPLRSVRATHDGKGRQTGAEAETKTAKVRRSGHKKKEKGAKVRENF